MQKAFFLDRDGTLNKDTNHVHSPEEWIWCSGAIEALARIQELGFKMIVVTNQSGISKGMFKEADTQYLHNWVDDQLDEHDIHIDGWYYAPYHPAYDNTQYDPHDRKPNTGMFEKAQEEYGIDYSQSYMAGDKNTDIQPALELGITPVFIRSRFEPMQNKDWLKAHNIKCYDRLLDAVEENILDDN
jgi:D-glycero-D-manno-heptose 1,7-bisphosphate phosphatase